MRKLISVGIALCIFAVLVSSASACIGPGCIKPINPLQPTIASSNGFKITSATSVSDAKGNAIAASSPLFPSCPQAQFAIDSGATTGVGSYSNGYASATDGGFAGASGTSKTTVNALGGATGWSWP